MTEPSEHGRTDDALDWALRYAALGFRVLPIKPGQKAPALDAWVDNATTDPELIRSWWTGLYAKHGVGLALGQSTIRPDRWLFAVDIDQHGVDGMAVWASLCSKYGSDNITAMALTGGGGVHLIFWSPFEVRNSRLDDGIDIRGAGGQIVVEPTIHPNGRPYSWDDGLAPWEHKVSRATDWLLDLLKPAAPVERTPSAPPDGDRPGDLWAAETSWADLLERDGWTLHHTDRDGEEHWTRPGKDRREGTSATVGYKGSDILKVFTSAVPFLTPEETYTKVGYLTATRYDGDFSAAAKALAKSGYRAPEVDLDELSGVDAVRAAQRIVDQLDTNEPPPSSLVDWATVFNRDIGGDWLLEPLLARGRGHALYAGQKAGKSLLVASVLVPAAMGHKVLDRAAGDPLRTLYLDYEMTHEDVAERVEAMGFNADNALELEPLAYHILPSIPPLDTAEGGRKVLEWALAHKAQLVVIDTFARAVAGAENDADTYRAYYRHTGLVLKAAGIATLRLDHSGKDSEKGQRGSSAKADDVDVVWKLTPREGGVFSLEATHKRMNWIPQRRDFLRHDEPLHYTQVTESWPAGTAEAAAQLDTLGAPEDIAVRAAVALLRGADHPTRTEVVRAAVKYRREDGKRAGKHFIHSLGNADGKQYGAPPLTSGKHAGKRAETLPPSSGNSVPPYKGHAFPRPPLETDEITAEKSATNPPQYPFGVETDF